MNWLNKLGLSFITIAQLLGERHHKLILQNVIQCILNSLSIWLTMRIRALNGQNFTLRENCPKTEFFLVRIFLYSVRIQENTDQKKLRIWTVSMHCQFSKIIDQRRTHNPFEYLSGTVLLKQIIAETVTLTQLLTYQGHFLIWLIFLSFS